MRFTAVHLKRLTALLTCVSLAACVNAPLSEPVIEQPVIIVEPGEIYASRDFAGPGSFPPSGFKGYGLLAFPEKPSKARGTVFCEAYLGGFSTVAELNAQGVSDAAQMVTVWPIKDADTANDLRASNAADDAICDQAIDQYGVTTAQLALRHAARADPRGVGSGTLDGRGPFLLAWSPGGDKGKSDVLVLVSDLSNVVSSEQADLEMRLWRGEVQQRSDLWSDGWSTDRLRRLVLRWADRNASSVLTVLGLEA